LSNSTKTINLINNNKNLSKSSEHLDERIRLLVPQIQNIKLQRSLSEKDFTFNNINNNKGTFSMLPINSPLTEQSLTDKEIYQIQIEQAKEQQADAAGLTHVYFRRWLILAVFCCISLLNAFNWIEYAIIQDVMITFYNESLPDDPSLQIDAVNWFSMVYMLCYIPLVFPTMFLLDRKGLKLSCVMGALLTAIGSSKVLLFF
jgi:hypothetical protein